MRLPVRPLKGLVLGSPSSSGENFTRDNVAPPHTAASVIHYHNNNEGHGILNNVQGDQQNLMNVIFNLNGNPSVLNDTPSVIEPYQSAIESLINILQGLHKLHETPSVLTLRKQVNNFIPIVACVAKTVETIRRISPQFATHTFFSDMNNQALQYGKSLKQLNVDIREFHIHFSDLMESGVLRGILLRIFATHRWPSLSRRIEVLVRKSQVSLERLLHLLVNPKWRRIVGDEHGELRRLATHAGLSSELDIQQLEVQTIWIQDPTGLSMYAIPLTFCTSWQDIRLVVKQYFRDGPESNHIRQGNWEMVHVDNNRVIDTKSFADMMKPEAVFDIGIIMHRFVAPVRDTCPQCLQYNSENMTRSSDGWIRCVACGKMFRALAIMPSEPLTTPESSQRTIQRYSRISTSFRRVSVRTHSTSPLLNQAITDLDRLFPSLISTPTPGSLNSLVFSNPHQIQAPISSLPRLLPRMELKAERRWESVGPQQYAIGNALFGCPSDVRGTILDFFKRPIVETAYTEMNEQSEDFSDDSN